MQHYVAPDFKRRAFNCPFCNAYANMQWLQAITPDFANLPIHRSECSHCHRFAYWNSSNGIRGDMIIPNDSSAPMPHPDMPEEVLLDYLEARDIVSKSPRGAAALLRLSIQKLCGALGEPGKHIDTDIKSLVAKGLPGGIQQALDVVRVVGNNAVHPGELKEEDISEVALSLFDLINMIIEEMISRPKALDALYNRLPEGARNAILKRDGVSKPEA